MGDEQAQAELFGKREGLAVGVFGLLGRQAIPMGVELPAGIEDPFIEQGSPRENGYVESFLGKMRAEPLKPETFYKLDEIRMLVKRWRQGYN